MKIEMDPQQCDHEQLAEQWVAAYSVMGRLDFGRVVLVGLDESAAMLDQARQVLPSERVQLHVARLEDRLPQGRFDLVVSALAVHHLDAAGKADLFRRVVPAVSRSAPCGASHPCVPCDVVQTLIGGMASRVSPS